MKLILFIALAIGGLSSSALAASLPLGPWYADSVTEDDGRYGRFYKSWLMINEDSIDQIYTLGAHYSKRKFEISRVEEGRIYTRDLVERENVVITFSQSPESLTFCHNELACTQYVQNSVIPDFQDPAYCLPVVEVSARWCVDQDCAMEVYLPVQGELFFNLETNLRPLTAIYKGPESLEEKYNILLSAFAISFRLLNKVDQLSSFSSSLQLIGNAGAEASAKTPVFLLQEGQFASMFGMDGPHRVSVDFYLKVLKK